MSDPGFKAKLRYKTDELLGKGAGPQLLFLLILTLVAVVFFAVLSLLLNAGGAKIADNASFIDSSWWYFTRFLDAGTMGGDEGNANRVVSTFATVVGVVVAGLLISSLAGNFQERLEAIKRGGSAVVESNHFVILGWSEKIYSVIDQLAEAYVSEGRIVCVVMAEREKVEMEEKLQDKIVHQDRVKIVVRTGSSMSLTDLSRASIGTARAVVVLLDDSTADDPLRADGRIVKSLMAIYNHPNVKTRSAPPRVTAEVMLSENQEIANIASGGRAQTIKTNEIISKIILQTSRISGLSLVYDELLRFEGNEVHFKQMPGAVGRRYGDVALDFPNGCLVGVAKSDGSGHTLNPLPDHVIGNDEEVLILAEDSNVAFVPYSGPLRDVQIQPSNVQGQKRAEHLLVLGWNEKIYPVVSEFDNYVGAGSSLTLVNSLAKDDVLAKFAERMEPLKNTRLAHQFGDFTSRALLATLQTERYPTVMVLGDAPDGIPETADTRAIIALLLLRDFRVRANVPRQEVCAEILDPKNRELAATTEIHDIVISNEMVSMILAQISYEPRVRAVLEDFFTSEGSEIYLKDMSLYVPVGTQTTFEYLIKAALARNESAMGTRRVGGTAENRFGITLNPNDRTIPFVTQPGDKLIVLAEDDG